MIFIIKNLKNKKGKILITDSMEKKRKDLFPDFNEKKFCDKLIKEYSEKFFLKNTKKMMKNIQNFGNFLKIKNQKE